MQIVMEYTVISELVVTQNSQFHQYYFICLQHYNRKLDHTRRCIFKDPKLRPDKMISRGTKQ